MHRLFSSSSRAAAIVVATLSSGGRVLGKLNSGGQRGLSEVKTVVCPGSKRAIGGGADLGTDPGQNGQQRQVTLSLSGPNGAGTGWSAQLFNNSTSLDTSIDLRVYAICASAG